MAKVVITDLRSKPAEAEARKTSLVEKRVRDGAGKMRILRTLDAGSSTFGNDFTTVFRKNVSRARRENKRATGMSDRDVAEA